MARHDIDEDEAIWNRQRGEPNKEWEAFSIYLHMEKRSCKALCETLSKSRQLISKWKSEWNWDERVLAFDRELEKETLKARVDERRKMYKRQAEVGVALQKYAVEALNKMKPEAATLRDVRELINLGAELERIGRTEIVAGYTETASQTPDDQDGDVVIYVPDNGLGGEDAEP